MSYEVFSFFLDHSRIFLGIITEFFNDHARIFFLDFVLQYDDRNRDKEFANNRSIEGPTTLCPMRFLLFSGSLEALRVSQSKKNRLASEFLLLLHDEFFLDVVKKSLFGIEKIVEA